MSTPPLVFLVSALALLSACGKEAVSSSNGGAASHSASVTDASTSTTVDASSTAVTTTHSSSSAATTGGGPCNLGETTTQSTADCAGYCNKLAEAACPADPSVADCITSCQTDVSYYAVGCADETVAVVACWSASGTVSCGADGHASIDGCPNETQLFDACTACIAVPGDSVCSCCVDTNCCQQNTVLLHRPDYPAYAACRMACNNNPGCWNNCDSMYPETGDDFFLYNACINGPCGTPCFGP